MKFLTKRHQFKFWSALAKSTRFTLSEYVRIDNSVPSAMISSVLVCVLVGCKGTNNTNCLSDDEYGFEDQVEGENIDIDGDYLSIPSQLTVTVEDFSVGNNGVTIPGVPAWFTLEKKKNLAICTTSYSGVTDCYPNNNLSRSLCPRTERCTYENVSTGGGAFVVSVFNINNSGKDTIEKALRFQCKNLKHFQTDKCEDIHSYVDEVNSKRAFWQGSFILSNRALELDERRVLEAYSRSDTLARIFPRSQNVETGAISAPFEVCVGDSYLGWDCDPLREISVKSELRE